MEHFRHKCFTIQFGLLVEQMTSTAQGWIDLLDLMRGVKLRVIPMHQTGIGLVPCIHEWIEVHDRRYVVAVAATGDEWSVHR